MTMNRHKQILAILLVIFCFSLVYAWFRMPRQQTAASTTANVLHSRVASGVSSNSRTSVSPTSYQALALPNEKSNTVSVKRNLFEPLPGMEPPKEPRTAVTVKAAPPPPLPLPPPPPTRQDLARNELSQYKPLGILKKGGKVVAFLSVAGQIKLIRVGESLIQGYKVTAINDNTLTVRADDGDTMTLRLR